MGATSYSYSRLTSFHQCEVKYGLTYVDKQYTRQQTVEQLVGIIVHKVIELDHEGKVPPGPTAHWEAVNQLFDERYSSRVIDVRDRGPEHWRGHAMKCISNYLRMGRVPDGWELAGMEARKGMPLLDDPPCSLMGVIDRHLVRGAAHSVEDFKSGKLKSQRDFEADHQLPLYAALVAHEYQVDAPIMVRRIYLGAGKVQSYLVDKDRRHEALMWAADTARAAQLFEAEYAATREADANKSVLCSWCNFKRKLCPAWQVDSPL